MIIDPMPTSLTGTQEKKENTSNYQLKHPKVIISKLCLDLPLQPLNSKWRLVAMFISLRHFHCEYGGAHRIMMADNFQNKPLVTIKYI